MTTVAACRLCLQVHALRHSHILPEFLYEPAYDDKHRALVLSRDDATEHFIQKGIREYLLCNDCEQQFGRYEAYFKRAWFDSNLLPTALKPGPHVHTIDGLDYKTFRLFHLSILWRASVSRDPMFEHVNLGPLQEDIRHLLVDEDPGPPDRYHWAASVLMLDGRPLDHLIMQPVQRPHRGRMLYLFVFGGCVWFYVASRSSLSPLVDLAFKEDGRQVLLVRHAKDMPPLRQFFQTFLEHNQDS